MRIIVIAILVALAVWAIVAGLLSKKRTSRGRVSWVLVAALLIPAGVSAYFEYVWQTDITKISTNVVQKISGVSTSKLECQRLTAAYIDVWASEKTIDAGKNEIGLKYNQCAHLLDYLRSEDKRKATPDQLKTFLLVSKESTRLAGKTTTDEALMCLGLTNLPLVVQGLGGSPDDGVYLYRLFKQEVFDKDKDYIQYKC